MRGVVNKKPKGKSFLGLGFGEKVPIDIVPIIALQQLYDTDLLIVDQFQRINGVKEKVVQKSLRNLYCSISMLNGLYGIEKQQLHTSRLMITDSYQELRNAVQRKVLEKEEFLQTARNTSERTNSVEYTIDEIACVVAMQHLGYSTKIGPSQEQKYDALISKFCSPMYFSYLRDAFPVATKEPEPVVHYIPTHTGAHNGQRIYLDESIESAENKISGPVETLEYLAFISGLSGKLLGQEIESFPITDDKRCRRKVKKLVVENILAPFQEVMAYE